MFHPEWFYMTQGDLMKELTRCSRRELEGDQREKMVWHWYMNCILQAEDRGFVKVVNNDDGCFYVRKFSETVQVISEDLKKMIEENGGKMMV
jgi:hypothetical protein